MPHKDDADNDTSDNNSQVVAMDNFKMLPDETVILIGRWVASYSIKDVVQFQRSSRRFRTLLQDPVVITQIIQDYGVPVRNVPSSSYPTSSTILNDKKNNSIGNNSSSSSSSSSIDRKTSNVETLEGLALYLRVQSAGLFQENRIMFDFASPDRNTDTETTDRMKSIRDIMIKFPNCTVTVDAHCGTLGPRYIALQFSRFRGVAISTELLEQLDDGDNTSYDEAMQLERRVSVNAWGRKVAEAASRSDHRFGALAREGKGWVELYVTVGNLSLPTRPEYYEGLLMDEDLSEEGDFRYIF